MATIVTRIGKGEALTFQEGDDNFVNLNTDKLESLIEDSAPQLGGNLITNNFQIRAEGTDNLAFVAGGTGSLTLATQTGADLLLANGNVTANADNSIELISQGDVFIELANGAVEFNFEAINLGDEQDPFLIGLLSNGSDTFPNMAIAADFLLLASSDQQTQISINQGGSGDIELSPQNSTVANSLKYNEVIHDLGTTDTPTIDVANGNVQTVTIANGLLLPAFDNDIAGQSVTLLVNGSGTATGTQDHLFAGGQTDLTNNSVVSIFYDGTNYWTSISTDFQ